MANKKILISIVNYKNWDNTIKCLASLQQVTYKYFTIFIIDNNSQNSSIDAILAWIRDNHTKEKNEKGVFFKNDRISSVQFKDEKIILVETKENYGFAGAHNISMDYAVKNDFDYILLLNNDTLVKDDFITPLLKLIESDIYVGIVGGKALSPEDGSIVGTGGRMDWLRGFGNNIIEEEKQDMESEVEFVSGCQMLVKREVLKTVGFLPEQYFLYYEDVDYCFRARAKGWKIYYEPKSIIWHYESASTVRGSSSRYYYLTRARIIFNKCYNKKFIIFAIYLSGLQFCRILKWLILGKLPYVKAAVKAQLVFLKKVKTI